MVVNISDSKRSTLPLLKLHGFCMCMCIFMCVKVHVCDQVRGQWNTSTPWDSFLIGWSSSVWLHWLLSVAGMSLLLYVTMLSFSMWTLRSKLRFLRLLAKYYIYWAISLGSRFSFKNYIKKHINTTQRLTKASGQQRFLYGNLIGIQYNLLKLFIPHVKLCLF